MKNNTKGFTLVELLGVVVILCILIALVTPNMVKLSKSRKQELYESKLKWVESNATLWGNKYIDTLSMDCTCVTIQELIDKAFLSGDNVKRDTIYDPRSNDPINEYNVCVKYNSGTDVVSADVLEPTDDNTVCN